MVGGPLLDAFVLACCGTAALAAVFVVLRPDVLHGALALVVVLLSLAGVYAGLGARFIAAIQIVVYAGAVVVLFLFAIMVLKSRRESAGPRSLARISWAGAVVAGGALCTALALAAPWREFGAGDSGAGAPPLSDLAGALFQEHLLAFELVGVLLLVAVVAVVALARFPAERRPAGGEAP